MLCNAGILLPFITEAVILHEESDVGEILNIFARFITEWEKEGENISGTDDDNDNNMEVTIEAEEKKRTKLGKAKQATSETLNTIADNHNDVLAFL